MIAGELAGRLPSVLVLGGGELGSAVAHRLVKSGLKVYVADLAAPACVRTAVCFAVALRRGEAEVEGVKALRAGLEQARDVAAGGSLPVIEVGAGADEWRRVARALGTDVLVDARMLKGGHGLVRGVVGFAIGLGPGFTAGADVDLVVETNRGPDLGRVIAAGPAEADTGVPAAVAGYGAERVIRSPARGVFAGEARIGDLVEAGKVVGSVAPAEGRPGLAVRAPIGGLLRGLVMDGTEVEYHQKIGDIDPRGRAVDARRISDKGRAVAGGVLEAVMHWWTTNHV